MAWECPHLDVQDDLCRRLNQPCVPGRPGCTLPKYLKFAVPVSERLARIESQKSSSDLRDV